MVQALTITITQATVGMVAVMILLAIVCGAASWFITGLVSFMGMDRGGKFYGIVATLHYPLIIVSVGVGAYLGYQLMS